MAVSAPSVKGNDSMTFARAIFLSFLAAMGLLGLCSPTHAQQSDPTLVGKPSPEASLTKFGGRILPYYLPDLVRYVDDDEVRLGKWLSDLKTHPHRLKELIRSLPPGSELGSLLQSARDEQAQLALLELKTVIFSVIPLKDEGLLGALDALQPPIRAQVKKIDLGYSDVIGDLCIITKPTLDCLKNKRVPEEVLGKLTSLLDQSYSHDALGKLLSDLLKDSEKRYRNDILICSNIFSHLVELPVLTDLDLSATALTTKGWNAIGHLGQIQRLWLRGTTITDSDFQNLLATVSDRLKLLSLANLTVTKDAAAADSSDANKIHVDKWVKTLTPMNASGRLTGLKYLSLAGNKLTNQNLTELNRFKELEGLDLADNPEITDAGLLQLNHNKLKELSVSGTGQPKNGKALPPQQPAAVQQLVAVTDTGVLGLLTRNKNTLLHLNLAGTATLAGPKSPAIVAIRQMKTLETLSLAGTGVNDTGLWEAWGPAEKDGRQLTWLVLLDISDTIVSDAGFVDDKGNVGFPKLKTIRIGATDLKVTTGGVNRRNAFMAVAFPNQFNRAKLVKPQ
jgi:hypothetical protein